MNNTILQQLASLHALAYTDPLTGIGNRAALERDNPPTGALVLCDLNKFKDVNDTEGHAAGDQVLITFARFLSQLGGEAYRLGGDEFVIVNLTRGAITAITQWVGPHGVTASVGATIIDDDGLVGALERADHNMYADKRSRRPSLNDRIIYRLTKLARIERRHQRRAAKGLT